MLLSDRLTLAAEWHLQAFEGDLEHDDEGRIVNPVVWEQRRRNLITTAGKGLALDRLFGLGGALAIAGTAVGTGSAAPAVTDTALTGAVYKVFDAAPVRSGLVVNVATTFGTAEANVTIAETGLQTAAAGVLLNRLLVGPFAKTTAVSLRIATAITQA